jgi:hypothetical protein
VTEKQFQKFVSEEELELTHEDIEIFREDFEDSIILSDQFLVILAVTRARESVQIEGYFEDQEEVERFAEYVNRFGVNCFIDHNLTEEETTVYSIAQMFSSNEEMEEKLDDLVGDADKIGNVFLTYNSDLGLDDVKEIARLREKDSLIKYHRRFGEFLHYPEEDIESFIFNQRPEWKKKLLKVIGRSVPPAVAVDKAAEKYSKDMDKKSKRTLNCFTDHVIRDTEESFQRTLSEAKNRRETVEKYTDTKKLIDEIFY